MRVLKLLLFNYFTRKVLRSSISAFIDFGKRLQTMEMDFSYQLSLFTVWIFIGFILWMVSPIIYPENSFLHILGKTVLNLFLSLTTFILINKDYFNGQSVANRLRLETVRPLSGLWKYCLLWQIARDD
jgi:hypothetical protein